MYLYSEHNAQLINMEHVALMYVSSTGDFIRVVLDSGAVLKIGRYENEMQSDAALKLIAKSIGSTTADVRIISMPTVEQADKAAERPEYHNHSLNGKKTVRRGGS